MKMIVTTLKLAIALTIASAGFPAQQAIADKQTDNHSQLIPTVEAITIQVNGNTLALEQKPIIINGTMLVPLRQMFETLGAEVQWDGNTSIITARKVQNVITLTIGSKTATRNSKQITLDVPPVITNGNTMVPLRFIAESLGSNVEWVEDTGTVRILTQPKDNKTPVSSLPFTNTIITGTFLYPWSNPLNSGIAKVRKEDGNRYHLNVSVVHGFSHNMGEIDTDFTFDGTAIVFSDPEYSQVSMTFTENSITIDYHGEAFGGFNAEPKGTFYLQNSGNEDASFLKKLYTLLQIPESYQHGFTDVFTYHLSKTKEALLIQSYSSLNRSMVISRSLVTYDTSTQQIESQGEITSYNKSDLSKKLKALSASEELIYELLNREYTNRFTEIQMQKFDNGDRTIGDPDLFQLTDAEAFFVVTGAEETTSITENSRNQDNIGSIFKTEVDHSDAKSVTIHIYELVRMNQIDEHFVTSDWLEVDRTNGRVKSILFE
ncbi:copper amine oxidase N-terminal domain-containing protein [Paenibacillus sp. WQ 127069]|uniref:Copper amine oxidase N-terminal domain-containing protein n=1 Tax=Paenibacillus baimaensis TaxID=2982185 RepID=A0ABT2UDG3_9BACL|nr:copper amine oxidase N-terminal domain-containing protein [Paenibacillus sp. WQ 127069]MCU6792688.1 copper amine oxidase N-terminal domain-containing protein [Paenibacillus sp. WQ 127069]